MEEVLTGVFSLGEVSMAEIVSLSQCPIGIGPCCLRMSARALGRQGKKRGKKCIFTQLEFRVCTCTVHEPRRSCISTINRKKSNSNNNKIKKYGLKALFMSVCLLRVFPSLPGYSLVSHLLPLIHFNPGLWHLSIISRADKLLLAHKAPPPSGATAGHSPGTS